MTSLLMLRFLLSPLPLLAIPIFIPNGFAEEVYQEIASRCKSQIASLEQCIHDECFLISDSDESVSQCQAKVSQLMPKTKPPLRMRGDKEYTQSQLKEFGEKIAQQCTKKYPNDENRLNCIKEECRNMSFDSIEQTECNLEAVKYLVVESVPDKQKRKELKQLLEPTEVTPDESLKNQCASQWEYDYQMQEFCYKQQREAADTIESYMKMYPEGTEERNILLRCAAQWKIGNSFDFVMVEFCAKQQLEAYRRLYK